MFVKVNTFSGMDKTGHQNYNIVTNTRHRRYSHLGLGKYNMQWIMTSNSVSWISSINYYDGTTK